MSFTSPPTAPNTSDPSTFATRADAHIAWQATHNTELNTYLAELTSLAAGTAMNIPYTFSSTTTDSDPGAGTLRLDNFAAQTSATVIRLDLVDAAGVTQTAVIDTFDDATSAIKGHIRLVKLTDPTKWLLFSVSSLASPSGYKNLTVVNIAGSSAAPFVNADDLVLLFTRIGDKGDAGASTAVTRVARTSNTILTSANAGQYIDVTSGTFTQTMDPKSSMGTDSHFWFGNSGTGLITLTPNAADYLDGKATRKIYPGELLHFIPNATGWTANVEKGFVITDTANGSWQPEAGYQEYEIELTGSGSGGGSGGSGGSGRGINTSSGSGGSGGGGGGPGIHGQTVKKRVPAATLAALIAASTTISYTLGAGGAGGAAKTGATGAISGAAGNDGTDGADGAVGAASTFGTSGERWYVSAVGGAVPTGNKGRKGLAGNGSTTGGNAGPPAGATTAASGPDLYHAISGPTELGADTAVAGSNSGASGLGGHGGRGADPTRCYYKATADVSGLGATNAPGGVREPSLLSGKPATPATPPQAPAGCGGYGGGGGAASFGVGAGSNSATSAGGDSPAGGQGGGGQIVIRGIR